VDHPAVALRVPFSPDHSPELQVAFWSEWMAAAIGHPAPLPDLLLVPGGSERGSSSDSATGKPAGGLWFSYRTLLPQDGEVLFYGRPTHEYLFDLLCDEKPEEADSAACRELTEKLDTLGTARELFGISLNPA